MRYTLIEQNGERALVLSLNGHKGCKVIARDVDHPEHGHAKLVDGNWIEDGEAKARSDENARLSRMSRRELIEEAVKRAKPNP